MDVLNEKDIREQIIDPALERIEKRTLPVAQNVLSLIVDQLGNQGAQTVDRAATEFANVASGLILSLQTTLDRLMKDLTTQIEALDGWTITIRLNKPAKE